MDKFSLYDKLLKSYRKAYPLKTHDNCRKEVVIIWKDIKTRKNVDELVNQKCVEWKDVELKSKSDFFSTRKKHSKQSKSSEVDASATVTESFSNDEKSAEKDSIPDVTSSEDVEINNLSRSLEEVDIGSLKSPPATIVRSYDTPAQMKLQKEIDLYNEEITTLTKRKECGLFTDEMRRDLKKKRELLGRAKAIIKLKRGDMIRKRKHRKQFKQKLAGIIEQFPETRKDLKVSRFRQQSMYQFDRMLKLNFCNFAD